MISLANLFKLSRHKHVEREVLDELFSLERSTLITTMLLETILLYILTPLTGNITIAWYGVIVALSLWRFYNAYDYHKNLWRNTLLIWHEKFVVLVWLTALLFSGLALYAIPKLDAYYQLFTFIVLIGISSGAIKALSSDHRTAIGYLLIILLPLAVEMLLLGRQETYILAFLVSIYLFVQINVLLKSYELSAGTRDARHEAEKIRKALYEKQEIIHHFFEQSDEAIFLYDPGQNLIDCNRTFEKIFALRREEVMRHTLETLPDKQWVAMTHKALHAQSDGHFGAYLARSGQEMWLQTRCFTMQNEQGETTGGIGLIKDKTAEHVSQQELVYMVLHDPMTGLSNRRGFQKYIVDLIYNTKHKTHTSLFFYMDINKFKQINDQHGHEAGDGVIAAVAKRFEELRPEDANLTRLGGDEFCMIIPHVGREEKTIHQEMEHWMRTIEGSFDEPFRVGDATFSLQCSIGAVYIDPGEMDVDRIVARADISMLQAKRTGSRNTILYSQDIEQGACQAYEVNHQLGDAIKEEQLQILYQPIAESEKGTVVAVEALVRWQHPQRGLLSPDEFLPVAIRSGQVTEVDIWMLHGVLKQIARWKQAGTFPLDYVSINVDVQSLIEESFIPGLLETMAQQGVTGSEIRLELTEFSLAENLGKMQEAMRELSRHGISCIVDDFGTGCLSLFHFKELPFEAIKIDRLFVEQMTKRIDNVFLIKAVIELAEKFRYDIIAKGVESSAQRKVIASLNSAVCLQGSLISRPLTAEELLQDFFGI